MATTTNDQNKTLHKEILVSIIIATFNAGQHLRACLASITKQVVKNIEIVIVDGGSTDDTIPIIKEFENANLRWISEPDKGIYDALNKGTKRARGKWLHFLGADDRLLPGFSELAIKLKEANTVYYGNSEEWFHGDTKPPYVLLVGEFNNYRLSKYCMNHQAIIYPASAFLKYSYNLEYKVFADYALNIQLWGDSNFKKQFYPITIASYNMNGFSSTTVDETFKRDKPALIRENMGLFIYLRFLYKRFKKRRRGEFDLE